MTHNESHERRAIDKAYMKLKKARKVFDSWLLNEGVDLADHIWLVDEAMELLMLGYTGKPLRCKPNPEKKKWKNMESVSILDVMKDPKKYKNI